MRQALPVFTPSLAPADLLERLFVARHPLVDEIVERIREAAKSSTRNHTLLVGPRGAGKTHLVSLVYHRAKRLRDEQGLDLQLAWLPEDPWSATSYRRLLDIVVDHLEPGLGVAEQPTTVEETEALLTGRAAEFGPLVCFVENLDQVLAGIGPSGQQRLRHLAQARVLLFVATTTLLSHDLSDQAAPFYSFFTTTRLQPLSIDEAADMLAKLAEHQGNPQAMAYLATDEAKARLRAVAHIAGGQPRIWAIMAQAITVGGLAQLVELLLTRFDDLTPYYQEQLARLSPQQREVVVKLAELDHPASVKEVAEWTETDQRSLAKTMIELRERGWVTETSSPLVQLLDQRRTYYELGEPLARLAFQLKVARDKPVQVVVEFLKSWFEPKQLTEHRLHDHQFALDYLHEAVLQHETDPVLAVSRRLSALPAGRVPVLKLLAQLEDACARLSLGDPEPLLRIPSSLRTTLEAQLPEQLDDMNLVTAASALRLRLHYEALKEFGHVPQPAGTTWIDRATSLLENSELRVGSLDVLADWLGRMWRFDEAEETLAELIRSAGPKSEVTITARRELAYSYLDAGDLQRAVALLEVSYADAVDIMGRIDENTLTLHSDLAWAYGTLGRFDEATAMLEEDLAVREELYGDDTLDLLVARHNLAATYGRAGRIADAIPLFETIITERERLIGADHPHTLQSRINLSFAYLQADRMDEALRLAEGVLADCDRVLGPNHPDTVATRLIMSRVDNRLGRPNEAIAMLEEAEGAAERILGPGHPDSVEIRRRLAIAHSLHNRIPEAVALLRAVIADCEEAFGPDHEMTHEARRALALIEDSNDVREISPG